MKYTRYLLAASLACIVVGSGAYIHFMRSPQLQPQLQQAAAPVEQKVASNDVAQAPATVQAKEEAERQAQVRKQIQTAAEAALQAEEFSRVAAAPSAAAAPFFPHLVVSESSGRPRD